MRGYLEKFGTQNRNINKNGTVYQKKIDPTWSRTLISGLEALCFCYSLSSLGSFGTIHCYARENSL